MRGSPLNRSRFVVGLILVAVAVLLFLFGRGAYATAGALTLGGLGLISVAISRR